jgi:nicotinate-nucleotide--dimethylbenzimidazole phosphoribosyltransferase
MIEADLKHKIDFKTKPLGALGMLEDLAIKIGTIQNTLTPELKNPTILVFAADHGITSEGVSPYPKEVTAQMVLNFLNGGAAINVFCKQNGITLKVVDAGVDFDFSPNHGLIHSKIARGTRNMMKEPAMTKAECISAMNKGGEIVLNEHKNGCNIIGFGEMGIGNTSSAALLMSRFMNLPVNQCTGRGTGLDDAGLKKKIDILQKISEKYPVSNDPLDTLATLGGLEIAMMAGAMIKAAELNMVIMVDGFITTAAIISSWKLHNNILKNCIFSHQSDESGHKLMLDKMGVKALLNLGMRLGEGTGAAIAYPVIKAAVTFLNEMASFESAGVSNKL